MENVQNKHVSETESSFPMKLVDQGKDYRINNDIMTRRLKNRERQRRYRARKRLEEEIKKASNSTVKQPTQAGTYFQPNGIANNLLTRVHCSRNWKKEARSANVSSRGLEASCNSSNTAARTSTSESQMQCLPSNLEPQFETQSHLEPHIEPLVSETAKKVIGRRNWKAEARKKKNGSDEF